MTGKALLGSSSAKWQVGYRTAEVEAAYHHAQLGEKGRAVSKAGT